MNYLNLIDILQKIINRKITHQELSFILDCSRANISKKVLNENSEVTVSDLIKIQNYFNIDMLKTSSNFPTRTISREFEIESSILEWGNRLNLIAKYNGLSDFEMAKILNIKESRYNSIVLRSLEPKLSELNSIKSNFNVSIDDLLYDPNNLFKRLKQKLEDEKLTFETMNYKEREEFSRFLKLKFNQTQI